MESGRGLARVIQQLQDEIRKLETENKSLRGQLTETSNNGTPENHTGLRRNVSVPALEDRYKENMIMTVRRYSISATAVHVPSRSNGDWARLRGGTLGLGNTAVEDRDEAANRRALQHCVNKARAKEKTVTFLLPVDDIYTNRPFVDDHLPDKSSCDRQMTSETES